MVVAHRVNESAVLTGTTKAEADELAERTAAGIPRGATPRKKMPPLSPSSVGFDDYVRKLVQLSEQLVVSTERAMATLQSSQSPPVSNQHFLCDLHSENQRVYSSGSVCVGGRGIRAKSGRRSSITASGGIGIQQFTKSQQKLDSVLSKLEMLDYKIKQTPDLTEALKQSAEATARPSWPISKDSSVRPLRPA
jgi:hypothetical protein